MTPERLQQLAIDIVALAVQLKDRHGVENDARVNYACIFTQSEAERDEMLKAAAQLGAVLLQTPSGPIFHLLEPLDTVAGKLRLLKIRRPDAARPERGDADFTVKDYSALRAVAQVNPAFNIVTRPECEMLELVDADLGVRAYVSDKPLDEELGLT